MPSRPNTHQDIAAHSLLALIDDALAEGRAAFETPDLGEAEVVHELRKALKRWRAILRLIAPLVGPEAKTLRIAARDLARELAPARDSAATREALADLDASSLPARSRTSIEARIAKVGVDGSGRATALTPAMRDHLAEALGRAADAVGQWPLDRFDNEEAARQLAAAYRRASDAVPQDWSAADANALHRLRRRVVDHRYQMELVEPAWPKFGKLWVSELQKLRERLGAHQDLAVLHELTEPHRPLAPWRSRLIPLIAARQAEHVADAEKMAGRIFTERPKAFRRRIAALLHHRSPGEKFGRHSAE